MREAPRSEAIGASVGAPATGAARTAAPRGTSELDVGPFRFAGDRRGLLLLHGFVGTPFEMRPLGQALARRGFTVHGPLLAGHAPGLRDLGGTAWPDWYASVEAALEELRADCDVVGVCGLSLGGLLTLELARRRRAEVRAIATLAAPLFIARVLTVAIRSSQRSSLLRRLAVPKLIGSDIADREMRRLNPRPAGGMPVRALGSLVELMDHVRPRVGEIDRPALVVHGRRDHTVPPASADAIANGLRGPVERMTLERSFHVLTLDVEREALFRRVGDFFEQQLAVN